MPLYVSSLIGDSLVVDWVFRSSVVTIRDVETYVDLIMLDMVDFDVILGMDFLSHHHAVMDWFAMTISLVTHDITLIVWYKLLAATWRGLFLYLW